MSKESNLRFAIKSIKTNSKQSKDFDVNVRNGHTIKYGHFSYLRKSGIYKIVCYDSDKIYIGSSKDVQNRVIKHFSLLRKNTHPNAVLQQDYNTFGFSRFDVQIIEETDVDLISKETKYQIEFGIENLYNELIKGVYTSEKHKLSCINADKSSHQTKEYREKMSKLKSNKIAKFDIKGEYIETYESSKFICDTFGYTRSVILSACNGSKKTAYGFQWRYVDNNNNILNSGRKRTKI